MSALHQSRSPSPHGGTAHRGDVGRVGFGRLLVLQIDSAERSRISGPIKALLAVGLCAAFAMMHPTMASTRVAGSPRAPLSTRPQSLDTMAREVVYLVNLERAQHQLPPLRVNTKLVLDARLQAEQIAETGVLDHVILSAAYPTPRVRAEVAGYAWNALGENLALGYNDASSAVAAWMQSPGHRANILAHGYSETGVVLAPDARGRLIFVQTFGAPE
jgi:uncharacterized protein YkwD